MQLLLVTLRTPYLDALYTKAFSKEPCVCPAQPCPCPRAAQYSPAQPSPSSGLPSTALPLLQGCCRSLPQGCPAQPCFCSRAAPHSPALALGLLLVLAFGISLCLAAHIQVCFEIDSSCDVAIRAEFKIDLESVTRTSTAPFRPSF